MRRDTVKDYLGCEGVNPDRAVACDGRGQGMSGRWFAMKRGQNKKSRWAKVCVMQFWVGIYAVLIVVLHVVPLGGGGVTLNTMTLGSLRADYLLHALLFMPWMVLLCVRLRWGSKWRVEWVRVGAGWAVAWMVLGIGLAVAAEGIQYWIPYRGFNPMDALFNSLGVLLGGVVVGLVRAVDGKGKKK